METQNIAKPQIKAALYIFLFFMIYSISMLVPPFQSPDEHDHFQRAYLLSHGKLMLETPEGESSGGDIDTGLLSYISNFTPLQAKPDARINSITENQSKIEKWTGKKVFRMLPGTGYYLPAIYVPQATAIFIGERLHLSVDTTYRMARFISMVSCLLILIIAFNIYKPNPLSLMVIVLPMTIFQMGSTTIDGLSISLTFLAISCFKRDLDTRGRGKWNFVLLAVTIFILVTCRSYMLPMIFMIIGAAVINRSKKRILISSATTVAIVAWISFAIYHTTDLRMPGKSSISTIISYYLSDPLSLWSVVSATLTNTGLVQMYWHSFIGILGALDTSLPDISYLAITIIFIVTIIINLNKQALSKKSNLILLLSGFFAIPLIFAAMLFTWTPHPATVILGVQGRYFTIPAILILYAVDRKDDFLRWFLTYVAMSLIAIVAIESMTPALLDRYYVSVPRASDSVAQVLEPIGHAD